ncbi:Glu-tRNA(Gln) amidotransferase subunit GatD [Candidatus Woesearchaeota archaeon]|nr:Glu-tRNA(Gln) amidotransferase subunit GatD [Candidatus Woesearchaeota archaeon]
MNEGDRVLVETKDKKFEGVVLPSATKGSVVLKLVSGYNVGIVKKEIKKSTVLEKYKKKAEREVKKIAHSLKKKTIAILHTGGTIASKVDYETGAVIARFTPEELVALFPELEHLVNIKSRLIGNMWSDDMRFVDYNAIAKDIEKELKQGVDGIIVTQGTDTLHSTAAALSFILEDLPVPVLIVGSQRSSDRGSSDARMNLVCAVEFMLQSDFAEVAVCMHKSMNDDICAILPGLKCRKMHSSRRDAFKAVNASPYAEVDFQNRKVHILDGSFKKRSKSILKLRLFKDVKVGWLRSRPELFASELKIYNKYDGLLLEGTGLGHMPIGMHAENKKIFAELKKLGKKIPVVMSTQTVFGRVDMNVYSPGRELQEIGVLGNYSSMTPETTYLKLAWLLSNYPKKVKEMMHQDIRGELSPRIGVEFLE